MEFFLNRVSTNYGALPVSYAVCTWDSVPGEGECGLEWIIYFHLVPVNNSWRYSITPIRVNDGSYVIKHMNNLSFWKVSSKK
jgi:hypothetical protein